MVYRVHSNDLYGHVTEYEYPYTERETSANCVAPRTMTMYSYTTDYVPLGPDYVHMNP